MALEEREWLMCGDKETKKEKGRVYVKEDVKKQ